MIGHGSSVAVGVGVGVVVLVGVFVIDVTWARRVEDEAECVGTEADGGAQVYFTGNAARGQSEGASRTEQAEDDVANVR